MFTYFSHSSPTEQQQDPGVTPDTGTHVVIMQLLFKQSDGCFQLWLKRSKSRSEPLSHTFTADQPDTGASFYLFFVCVFLSYNQDVFLCDREPWKILQIKPGVGILLKFSHLTNELSSGDEKFFKRRGQNPFRQSGRGCGRENCNRRCFCL